MHVGQCFPNCASRLPGEERNYVRGGVKKLEKTKNSNLLLKNSNSNPSFSVTNLLTNSFNSSDFYFILLQLLTTDSVFFKIQIIFKDSSIFIFLHFLQLVT
jgi:hypothetical protein